MKQKINSQNMIFLAIVTLFWFAQYVYIPYQTTKKKRFREQPDSAGTASGVPGQTDHCVFPDRADPAGDSADDYNVIYKSDIERLRGIGRSCGNIIYYLYGVRSMFFRACLVEILREAGTTVLDPDSAGSIGGILYTGSGCRQSTGDLSAPGTAGNGDGNPFFLCNVRSDAGDTEREEIYCHGIFPGGICNRNDHVSDVYRKHCLSGRYGGRISGPGRDCDSGDHNRKSILHTGNLQRHLSHRHNLTEN